MVLTMHTSVSAPPMGVSIARKHVCVRYDSETHETVLLV